MKNQELGYIGEELACRFLLENNFIILEKNWRHGKAEVDIIAKEKDILVFIEVKTRSSDAFGKPEDFVSKSKERLLADAAAAYRIKVRHDWEFRFDVISILYVKNTNLPKPRIEIEHFRDAFFPGW